MKKTLKRLADPFARVFWRAMIGLMQACPPVCGMIADGAYRAHLSQFKSLLPLAARVPRMLLLHWRDKREKRVALAQVYIGVTTRCTLYCDKCTMHLSDLSRHEDMPTDELLGDIRALLACVDHIYDFCFGGGEPFLHPDLDQAIRLCAESGKIGNLKILINGTVVPGGKVLAALRDAGAQVNVSNYRPMSQTEVDDLIAVLTEHGISYNIYPAARDYWVDTGSFGQLKDGSPAWRFRFCFLRLYNTYIDGLLHLCPQSAVLTYDGRLPQNEADYINMRAVDPAAFRGIYQKLNKRTELPACAYCLGQTYKTPKIPAAAQRVPMEPINLEKEPLI